MQLEIKKTAALDEIRKFFPLNATQIKNLEDFVELLLQENDNFNFIGKSTIEKCLASAQALQSKLLLIN